MPLQAIAWLSWDGAPQISDYSRVPATQHWRQKFPLIPRRIPGACLFRSLASTASESVSRVTPPVHSTVGAGESDPCRSRPLKKYILPFCCITLEKVPPMETTFVNKRVLRPVPNKRKNISEAAWRRQETGDARSGRLDNFPLTSWH